VWQIRRIILEPVVSILSSHAVDELRMLGLNIMSYFAKNQDEDCVHTLLFPTFCSMLEGDSSAAVRRSVVELFPPLLSGTTREDNWQLVKTAIELPFATQSLHQLLPKIVSHYADIGKMEEVWEFLSLMLKSVVPHAAPHSAPNPASPPPPPRHGLFFATLALLKELVPLLSELMDEEEEEMKVEDLLIDNELSIKEWQGLKFFTNEFVEVRREGDCARSEPSHTCISACLGCSKRVLGRCTLRRFARLASLSLSSHRSPLRSFLWRFCGRLPLCSHRGADDHCHHHEPSQFRGGRRSGRGRGRFWGAVQGARGRVRSQHHPAQDGRCDGNEDRHIGGGGRVRPPSRQIRGARESAWGRGQRRRCDGDWERLHLRAEPRNPHL